jgi:predicted ATP-grasp superfamily ATP-dependent carboligase
VTPVGVVGASARAAVHSLARAGLSAWAVDQFNDRDLARVAPCALCPEGGYPHALPELAARFPPGPVLYTGGLENHPQVVAELARTRELWGNPAHVLPGVRDPFALAALLARTGFRVPQLIAPGAQCPAHGRWVRKPLRSGGGLGVRFARPGEPATAEHVFQEFSEGAPMSALFVNDALFGVTEQLIGEAWLHAAPFAYCGNIGPLHVPSVVPHLNALCETGLRGVWGADFVLCAGEPVVLEVNPRYTAAIEVLELATGRAALTYGGARRWEASAIRPTPPAPLPKGKGESRLAALDGADTDSSDAERSEASSSFSPFPLGRGAGGVGETSARPEASTSHQVAKAIYYAPHAIRFPHSGPWDADLTAPFDPWRVPGFADIPEAGAHIEAGWPVLTLFAEGTNARRLLQSRAAELDSLFREHQP